MPNGTYGGVRGRKTKVGRKLLRFPPTRLFDTASVSSLIRVIPLKSDPFSKVFRGITLKTFFELPILGYN